MRAAHSCRVLRTCLADQALEDGVEEHPASLPVLVRGGCPRLPPALSGRSLLRCLTRQVRCNTRSRIRRRGPPPPAHANPRCRARVSAWTRRAAAPTGTHERRTPRITARALQFGPAGGFSLFSRTFCPHLLRTTFVSIPPRLVRGFATCASFLFFIHGNTHIEHGSHKRTVLNRGPRKLPDPRQPAGGDADGRSERSTALAAPCRVVQPNPGPLALAGSSYRLRICAAHSLRFWATLPSLHGLT